MLDHLAYVIEQTELVRPLVEHQLFRGRKRQPGEVFNETAQLGAPTAQRAEAQRMSPAGISFFYGSGEAETCLAELRGLQGELATVGRWRTTQPFTVLDLVDLPETPSIFDPLYGEIRDLFVFARWFVGEITRPVLAHDRPSVDYVASQVVAEFIRFELKGDNGAPVHGVRYPSVARPGGVNVALFGGPDLHEAQVPRLVLEAMCEYQAEKVKVTWSRVDP
jgi:hypothetical protein